MPSRSALLCLTLPLLTACGTELHAPSEGSMPAPELPPFANPPPVHWLGDFYLDDAADLEAAENLIEITGQLVIHGERVDTVKLPILEVLGGLSIAGAGELRALELGGLVRVEGPLQITGVPQLEALALTRLRRIEGDLVLRELGIESLALPMLLSVSGNLEISANPRLPAISLPDLRGVGESLCVRANPLLATPPSLPRLELAAEVKLCDNPGLIRADIESLEEELWLRRIALNPDGCGAQ